jgi:hypothetical protein
MMSWLNKWGSNWLKGWLGYTNVTIINIIWSPHSNIIIEDVIEDIFIINDYKDSTITCIESSIYILEPSEKIVV